MRSGLQKLAYLPFDAVSGGAAAPNLCLNGVSARLAGSERVARIRREQLTSGEVSVSVIPEKEVQAFREQYKLSRWNIAEFLIHHSLLNYL